VKPIYYDTYRDNVGGIAYYIPTVWKTGGTHPLCPPPNCAHAYN